MSCLLDRFKARGLQVVPRIRRELIREHVRFLVYLVVQVLVRSSLVIDVQTHAAILQLLGLELSQKLNQEESNLQVPFELVVQLVLHLLGLLCTFDQ